MHFCASYSGRVGVVLTPFIRSRRATVELLFEFWELRYSFLQCWKVQKIVYKYDLILVGMDLLISCDLEPHCDPYFLINEFELDVSSPSSVFSSYDVQNASML